MDPRFHARHDLNGTCPYPDCPHHYPRERQWRGPIGGAIGVGIAIHKQVQKERAKRAQRKANEASSAAAFAAASSSSRSAETDADADDDESFENTRGLDQHGYPRDVKRGELTPPPRSPLGSDFGDEPPPYPAPPETAPALEVRPWRLPVLDPAAPRAQRIAALSRSGSEATTHYTRIITEAMGRHSGVHSECAKAVARLQVRSPQALSPAQLQLEAAALHRAALEEGNKWLKVASQAAGANERAQLDVGNEIAKVGL